MPEGGNSSAGVFFLTVFQQFGLENSTISLGPEQLSVARAQLPPGMPTDDQESTWTDRVQAPTVIFALIEHQISGCCVNFGRKYWRMNLGCWVHIHTCICTILRKSACQIQDAVVRAMLNVCEVDGRGGMTLTSVGSAQSVRRELHGNWATLTSGNEGHPSVRSQGGMLIGIVTDYSCIEIAKLGRSMVHVHVQCVYTQQVAPG